MTAYEQLKVGDINMLEQVAPKQSKARPSLEAYTLDAHVEVVETFTDDGGTFESALGGLIKTFNDKGNDGLYFNQVAEKEQTTNDAELIIYDV